MSADNKNKGGKNDTLAFIIGGLFILGLVFATYNYFSEQSDILTNNEENQELSLDRLRETLSTRTDDPNDEEALNEVTDPNDVLGAPEETAVWVANNYEEGDIDTGEYSVVAGDTLWELAEGAYGDGSLWTLIRDANAENIGFLPNGQQSLIYAGQTLVIPSLTT